MRKVAVIGLGLLTLYGCSNSITSIEPLTMEEVAGNRLEQLSQEEKDGLIYNYITGNITVDKENLIEVDNSGRSKIGGVLSSVNQALAGVDNSVIKPEFTNYMLTEFAKTPYEWAQSSVDLVGFDPSTRLYFVDVTYSTTSNYKRVVPTSKIPSGSKSEEELKRNRYSDYIYYLKLKQQGSEQADVAYQNFVNTWGDVAEIMNEQQGTPLLTRTRYEPQDTGGVGKLTYTGLIKESQFNTGAKMTFRYVMKYRYNLGEETDMFVDSLYLKDYELVGSDKLIENLTNKESIKGLEVLQPFIDRLINSYNKAVVESNDVGLYSLYVNYGDIDKYFADRLNYTYSQTGSYIYEILQRRGTNVYVKVDVINKVRAKGSNMSLPSYKETLVYNLVLNSDDTIKVNSVNLVKSELVGEPISVIRNVAGVSNLINYSTQSFTDTNREKVIDTLSRFSEIVLSGDTTSTAFTSVIDLGISDANLRKIRDNISSIPDANRKVTYIVSWDTTTNVFVSVKLREVFEGGSQNRDTEAVVDLINRNGDWRVVNYNRTLNVNTSSAKASTSNALFEHKK